MSIERAIVCDLCGRRYPWRTEESVWSVRAGISAFSFGAAWLTGDDERWGDYCPSCRPKIEVLRDDPLVPVSPPSEPTPADFRCALSLEGTVKLDGNSGEPASAVQPVDVARARSVMSERQRTTTGVRFPVELHEALTRAAEERDVSVNWLVNKAVADFLPRLIQWTLSLGGSVVKDLP